LKLAVRSRCNEKEEICMKEVSDAEAAIEEALAKLDIDYIMK
jgi:hypothetical protein